MDALRITVASTWTASDGTSIVEPGMAVLTKPFVMEALASRIKDLILAP